MEQNGTVTLGDSEYLQRLREQLAEHDPELAEGRNQQRELEDKIVRMRLSQKDLFALSIALDEYMKACKQRGLNPPYLPTLKRIRRKIRRSLKLVHARFG